MRKLLLAIIFVSAFSLSLLAQSIEVVNASGQYEAQVGEMIKVPVKIRNNSDKPLNLVIKRIGSSVGTSQITYFCWEKDCYDPSDDELPLSRKIGPGEINSSFINVLDAGLADGFSSVRYLIYDKNDPTNALEYELSFSIKEQDTKKAIFDSKEIVLQDVYPNPVTEFAVFEYQVLDKEVEAKIIFHNVLGSMVGEYELPNLGNTLKIKTGNMNPGVYFYTLYLDNDGVMTRKLIVRR